MQQMKARGILHTHTLGIIYVWQVIMVLYIYTAFSILLMLYSRFAKPKHPLYYKILKRYFMSRNLTGKYMHPKFVFSYTFT